MDLELSADDALLFDSVREYVRGEVAPVAGQWDGAGEIPRKAWEAAATLGLTGIRAPEDLGGAGMDAMALAVAIEAVAAASGSLAWVLAVHNALALGHALQVGDATLAASLTSGKAIGAFAALPEVWATSSEDGWHLAGRGEGVTLDPVRGVLVLVASTAEGPTAFRVDARSLKFQRARTLGIAAASVGSVELDGPGLLVGAVGQAGPVVEAVQRAAAPVFAALSVGLGQGALDAALRYATERQQFGRPIADFQAVQWMLADAGTELEAARLLSRRAAASGDAADGLAARILAADAGLAAADRAIQIHGGAGYTTDYPVERAWRDAQRLLVGVDAARVVLGQLSCA
ncbi:MAG: acyl-CoA dehydrogenase family protein [Myxococcales bacterium]|nr:acyl-CoA dehydrogenase family protein [Myxococcales bacterium]